MYYIILLILHIKRTNKHNYNQLKDVKAILKKDSGSS